MRQSIFRVAIRLQVSALPFTNQVVPVCIPWHTTSLLNMTAAVQQVASCALARSDRANTAATTLRFSISTEVKAPFYQNTNSLWLNYLGINSLALAVCQLISSSASESKCDSSSLRGLGLGLFTLMPVHCVLQLLFTAPAGSRSCFPLMWEGILLLDCHLLWPLFFCYGCPQCRNRTFWSGTQRGWPPSFHAF